jgi:uncharacterized protein
LRERGRGGREHRFRAAAGASRRLNATLARNIVEFRDANGAFRRRGQLLKVPRLGDQTFEQAAGFLRIIDGDNPLDRSAVHPEAYPVVERILAASGRGLHEMLGNAAFLKTLEPARFTDSRFGLPTVRDILLELEKPGRDPRPGVRNRRVQGRRGNAGRSCSPGWSWKGW